MYKHVRDPDFTSRDQDILAYIYFINAGIPDTSSTSGSFSSTNIIFDMILTLCCCQDSHKPMYVNMIFRD